MCGLLLLVCCCHFFFCFPKGIFILSPILYVWRSLEFIIIIISLWNFGSVLAWIVHVCPLSVIFIRCLSLYFYIGSHSINTHQENKVWVRMCMDEKAENKMFVYYVKCAVVCCLHGLTYLFFFLFISFLLIGSFFFWSVHVIFHYNKATMWPIVEIKCGE